MARIELTEPLESLIAAQNFVELMVLNYDAETEYNETHTIIDESGCYIGSKSKHLEEVYKQVLIAFSSLLPTCIDDLVVFDGTYSSKL